MKKLLLSAIITFSGLSLFAQDQLPDISLFDINGNKVNVSEYANDSTIQIFSFWATWCVPCKEELNNIAEIYADWQKDYHIQIIAVSIDDAKTRANVKAYAEGQGWDYIVLLDQNKELHRLLGGQSVPYTVITNASGMIVDKHTGYIEGDEYILEDKIKEMTGN
ncbi:MAG: TlpA disulfide reductase family protein [Chitinophagales bacterium]